MDSVRKKTQKNRWSRSSIRDGWMERRSTWMAGYRERESVKDGTALHLAPAMEGRKDRDDRIMPQQRRRWRHGEVAKESMVRRWTRICNTVSNSTWPAGSWYTYDVNLLVVEDLATGSDLPNPDAYTINGQLGDFYNCSKETTYRLSVDYGKSYLLCIINAVMSYEIFFSIVRHNLLGI
ncbi:hypothetical protein Q3G72_030118 [Acer saccharum]|nr:hypothetical protein Q3G72_030118 [Acer saccharum]